MANDFYTIADFIKLKDDNYAGLFIDTLTAFPLVNRLRAFTVKDTTVDVPIINGLPTGSWRLPYEGKKASKGKIDSRSIALKYFDASMGPLDVAAARGNPEGGESGAIALATQLALKGAEKDMETCIMYGDGSEAFKGLKPFIDKNMIVNAGGATAGGCSDVFAITSDIRLSLGKDGSVRSGDGPQVHYVSTEKDAGYHAWTENISIWLAMICSGRNSAGRIANLDAAKGLNDDLLADLLEKFEVGFHPECFVMSKRSLGQLRRSRTATNPTGEPAPFPTEAHGIPIVVVGTINDKQDPETLA